MSKERSWIDDDGFAVVNPYRDYVAEAANVAREAGNGAENADTWIMLCFKEKSSMANFINVLTEKYGKNTLEQIRAGVNAINVNSSLYGEIKDELTPGKFGYEVR